MPLRSGDKMTNKNLQKEIEKILKPVQTGELCPENGDCHCLEKATDQLLALFRQTMEEAIGKEVPYPNTAGISKDFAEVIDTVIKDIRANLERILE